MTIQQVQNLFNTNTIKKGKLTKIVYEKGENGYTKTTTMVVRFVNYYNTKAFKSTGRQPSTNINPNIQVLIPHILTYNTNTQNYLLHCYPTAKTKPHTIYKNPFGQEIDKATYEQAVPPKKKSSYNSPVLQVKVQDLVSIG